jgi:hypothetical protein
MCNQLQRMDIPPNHRFVAPNLNSKSPLSWGYESTRKGVSIVHSQPNITHNKLIFLQPSQSTNSLPLNLHNPRNGIPFSAHSPSGLPTSLQGSNIGWLGISLVGDSRDYNCNRKTLNNNSLSLGVISYT